MLDRNKILNKSERELLEDPTSCKANFRVGVAHYELKHYEKATNSNYSWRNNSIVVK